MNGEKLMVRPVDPHSCPCCEHSQFVVMECELNKYLTGIDGTIVDHEETYYSAAGKCVNCGAVVNMMPTNDGFIPFSPLKKLLYDQYIFEEDEFEWECEENPMLEERSK